VARRKFLLRSKFDVRCWTFDVQGGLRPADSRLTPLRSACHNRRPPFLGVFLGAAEERGMEMQELLQKTVDELHEKLDHPGIDIEAKKIDQKLREARYNPGDVTPLADCMLAILLAARSQGFTVRSVFRSLQKVAEDIGSKKWKKMPDGTYHVLK
jgi:hypothetical protein